MAPERLEQPTGRPAELRRGPYPIPLNTETTAAFLGRTERGPVNEPIGIESFPEYCRYFGGHFADGAVSHAVQDFFLHGGRRAVVVRLTNRATRAEIELPTIDDDVLRLRARYPGRREILRVSIDYEQVEDDDGLFNLVAQRLGSAEAALVEDQEIYPLVSMRRSDPRFVGDVLEDSRLIALAGPVPAMRPAATPPVRPGDPVRYVGVSVNGDDGDELTDYDIIGSDRDGTGLFALLRAPRTDLLTIPLPPERELGSTALVATARFCERRRALLIWDPPCRWRTVDTAMLGSRQADFTSGNIMTYFPRIRPRGARIRYAGGMPASGAIAGMLAQRDRRGLWGSVEDSDYVLRSALTPVVDVSLREAERLARYGLNSFVHAAGGSTRLIGRVTLGAAGFAARVRSNLERRRLGFFILNSIEEAAMAAAGSADPHSAVVRLELQLSRFFDELYLRGALLGRTPGQAYYLLMRPEQAWLGFGFALHEPARFLEYRVSLEGESPGTVKRTRALEAEQLFN